MISRKLCYPQDSNLWVIQIADRVLGLSKDHTTGLKNCRMPSTVSRVQARTTRFQVPSNLKAASGMNDETANKCVEKYVNERLSSSEEIRRQRGKREAPPCADGRFMLMH